MRNSFPCYNWLASMNLNISGQGCDFSLLPGLDLLAVVFVKDLQPLRDGYKIKQNRSTSYYKTLIERHLSLML